MKKKKKQKVHKMTLITRTTRGKIVGRLLQ